MAWVRHVCGRALVTMMLVTATWSPRPICSYNVWYAFFIFDRWMCRSLCWSLVYSIGITADGGGRHTAQTPMHTRTAYPVNQHTQTHIYTRSPAS